MHTFQARPLHVLGRVRGLDLRQRGTGGSAGAWRRRSPPCPCGGPRATIPCSTGPEPIHTSPTRMSSSSILFLPLTVSDGPCRRPSRGRGPPSSCPCRRPWRLPLAVELDVTSSPGRPSPRSAAAGRVAETMWLPITLGSLTSARTSAAPPVTRHHPQRNRRRASWRLFSVELTGGHDEWLSYPRRSTVTSWRAIPEISAAAGRRGVEIAVLHRDLRGGHSPN